MAYRPSRSGISRCPGQTTTYTNFAGGAIATSLDALYTYMTTRLVDANVKRDVAAVDEVVRLLRPLRDAWAQTATPAAAAAGSRP